jgi:PAS domain S-box-containing protein
MPSRVPTPPPPRSSSGPDDALAERAAEEALSRLAAIVESSNDAILGQDVDGVITSWNAAAEEMYGYTADEIVGKPIHVMVPADRIDELKEIYSSVLAGDRVEHFETERLRRDGERLQVSISISPIHDRTGRIVGLSKIARDIGPRKQIESALQQANAAKDQFLAALSHELRTPLTPVLALVSDLAEDPQLPPAVRAKLAVVRRNAELEARLIDDLLDLTRITHGKLEIKPEVTDLYEVMEHALDICCRQEVEAGRLKTVRDLAASERHVWGDASRLTQVFWNLFKNAVKFMPEGGELRVRTAIEESTAPPGRRLRVEISDTGIGIDPVTLPRIFNGFEQGPRAITRQFGGLGLGLAISKVIVDLHGGHLSATSAGLGQGATFTVELPLIEPAAAPAPEVALGREAERVRGGRILLVEDHADTAAAFAELLRASGYEVTVAGGVQAGLASAAAATFDLVISDLGLPDGNGADLMRELARLYRLPGIALSGYGMEEDVRQSRDAGFSQHLTKPVNLHVLREAIRQVLAERGEG